MTKTVIMRQSITGLRDGVEWPAPGGEIDLPDDEADTLIVQGLAAEKGSGESIPELDPPAEDGENVGPVHRAEDTKDAPSNRPAETATVEDPETPESKDKASRKTVAEGGDIPDRKPANGNTDRASAVDKPGVASSDETSPAEGSSDTPASKARKGR